MKVEIEGKLQDQNVNELELELSIVLIVDETNPSSRPLTNLSQKPSCPGISSSEQVPHQPCAVGFAL